MDNLLIKIRLEALKNNLDQIQSIFKSVKARRGDIDTLSLNIRMAGESLDTIIYNAGTLKNNTQETTFGSPKVDSSLKTHVETVLDEGSKLRKILQDFKTNIEVVTKRWAPIERVEGMVGEDLEEAASRNWKEKIEENLKALQNAKQGEVDAVMEKAWKVYTEIMSEQMRIFFSKYVEFLGGLALRDAGLDEGICRIADELISSCGAIGKTNWKALTIPASQEAVTLARSIRMGFPEWTIWAVPLTAHELGQVAMEESTSWESYILKQIPKKKKNTKAAKREQRHIRICLADAFATYVMGPAYACSAILLRFNPLLAYQDSEKYPTDAKRAHIILNMLKKMLERDKFDVPPYGDTVTQLETGWNAALARAKPPGSLTEDDKKRLEDWSEYMFEELSDKGLYEGKRLTSTRSALENLLKGQDPAGDLNGQEEGRDVLNAAWECRMENANELRTVERKAQELWDMITEKKGRDVKSEQYPVIPAIPGDKSWPKVNQ